MRIHITYTGGTIGMIDSPNGLIPGADTRGWLFRLLEDAHMDASLFTFTELDPLIDSSNATPDNWQTMVDDLRAHRDDADAIARAHGHAVRPRQKAWSGNHRPRHREPALCRARAFAPRERELAHLTNRARR